MVNGDFFRSLKNHQCQPGLGFVPLQTQHAGVCWGTGLLLQQQGKGRCGVQENTASSFSSYDCGCRAENEGALMFFCMLSTQKHYEVRSH